MDKKIIASVVAGVILATTFALVFTRQQPSGESAEDYLLGIKSDLEIYVDMAYGMSPYIEEATRITENDNVEAIFREMLVLRDSNRTMCRHFAPALFMELVLHGHSCRLEAGVLIRQDGSIENVKSHSEGFYMANHVWVRLENGDILDSLENGEYHTYVQISGVFISELPVDWIGEVVFTVGDIFVENLLWL